MFHDNSTKYATVLMEQNNIIKLMKAPILSCVFLLCISLYNVWAYNITATCSTVSLLCLHWQFRN
jgi:hypothetical protein